MDKNLKNTYRQHQYGIANALTKSLLYLLLFLALPSFSSFGQTGSTNKSPKPVQSERATNIPKPIGYVNDFEGIFNDEEEAVLDSLIKDFEAKTHIEIAVVTLNSSMTSKADFDQFTLKLANEWGVGKKDKNNGILIGISASLRSMRIQNSYGIEMIVTNEETKNLIDTVFIPNFKNGNYFEGTKQGILRLINRIDASIPKVKTE